MITHLLLLGLAFVAGCATSNSVALTGASSSSGAGSGTGGTGAGGASTNSVSTDNTNTSSIGTGGTSAASSSTSSTGATSSASAGNGGAGTGGGFSFDAGPPPDASWTGPAEIYGQSVTTLFKLDPLTQVLTTVGDFVGCDAVYDIAVNQTGQMWAVTESGVFAVDPATAVCTLIAHGDYPNSLSFVPAGTLDPNMEALVGYVGPEYMRIDPASGVVTHVGSLGNQGYIAGGDLVSVIGGGTYLTVQEGPQSCSDCIVQVNPATGALVKYIGAMGHADVNGLAYWSGSAFGWDVLGQVFTIDLTSGKSTTIPLPNVPPGLGFFGAGSTTAAPL